ncbi:MAG: CDP-glucose 4,6-dehydratase [Betaproteobacteria bacterium]|nr:CDP-glucose 4,6-dehydratase [Betaproteobacteria bacterium]
MVTPGFWAGKRVFLTGHTGFKGSWLSLWLQSLGAEVTGYALAPATTPSLFDLARVGNDMPSIIADIRDIDSLFSAVRAARPQIVLHLAAQALVSDGYRDPLGTLSTNVQGTANLLEALREESRVEAVVVVTSDKCYDNREWPWPYRESDPLGGHDPYSASKACAELVTASYRKSFLAEHGIAVATARAGNVFGGGDWSPNRLVPDLLAAFAGRTPAIVRRPGAIRPWQHVLEPLQGYLMLAERIAREPRLAGAWNFGPCESDCLTVGDIATRLAAIWGEGASWHPESSTFPHEASMLRLDSSQARERLGWRPCLTIDSALAATVSWYRAWLTAADMQAVTLAQIRDFHTHASR